MERICAYHLPELGDSTCLAFIALKDGEFAECHYARSDINNDIIENQKNGQCPYFKPLRNSN